MRTAQKRFPSLRSRRGPRRPPTAAPSAPLDGSRPGRRLGATFEGNYHYVSRTLASHCFDKPAAINANTGEVLDYATLNTRSAQLAHYFKAQGLGVGTMSLFMENNLRFFLEVAWRLPSGPSPHLHQSPSHGGGSGLHR